MFLPEYTITSKILKNIADIEYSKAVIENATLLSNWQRQLEKEALIKTIYSITKLYGASTSYENIKRYIDGLNKVSEPLTSNLKKSLELTQTLGSTRDIEDETLKTLHTTVSRDLINTKLLGTYRSKKIPGFTSPEMILAEVVELFDWYNSLDGRETHPIILAAILRGQLELIKPFDETNAIVADLAVRISLTSNGYHISNFSSLEDRYIKTKSYFDQGIYSIIKNDHNFTDWIQYFTEEFSHEIVDIKEKVLLLARDSKLSKVNTRAKLTDRQQRILEHLQDYGLLQNKDFEKIFPGVSEDSVLRDLKVLINEGIIVKTGSTKSSRYELV